MSDCRPKIFIGAVMKMVNIVSERNFNELIGNVPDDLKEDLWAVWRDELSTNMSKIELLTNANGLLTYYGSDHILTDVDWDMQQACFLWEVHTC